MVLLEALARRRPVIVFEEIEHVIGDKKGIFVAKRNFLNFYGTLNHIKKNYKKIQKDMMKKINFPQIKNSSKNLLKQSMILNRRGGRVVEGAAWKACKRETVSRVRIPLSPPFF